MVAMNSRLILVNKLKLIFKKKFKLIKITIMANLLFKNKQEINGENYQELSAIYISQMAKAATLGFGKDYTTAEQFLEETGDGDIEESYAELWDVADEKNPDIVLYNCWVYLADTATVFHAGTDTDTGIGMSQWSFNTHTNDADNQLAQDLQKAFNAKPKE